MRRGGARRGVMRQQGVLTPAGSIDDGSHPASWIDFLLHFDIDFRRRRLSFVVRAINELYSRLAEPEFRGLEPRQIDDLKQRFQRPLSRLRMLSSGEFAYPRIRARLVALATALDGSTDRPEARNAPADKTLPEMIAAIKAPLSNERYIRNNHNEL